VNERPSAVELLARSGALLDRDGLRELGLPDGDVERLLRAVGVVAFPGVRHVYVDTDAARAWIEERYR
jgi:hypothetical protein